MDLITQTALLEGLLLQTAFLMLRIRAISRDALLLAPGRIFKPTMMLCKLLQIIARN